MQFDYLHILLQNGFKMPTKDDRFDGQTMESFIDRRREELQIVFRVCFKGLRLRSKVQSGKLLFEANDGTEYEVTIEEDHILCEPRNNQSKKYRGFEITKFEDGTYNFKQIIIDDIVLVTETTIPSYEHKFHNGLTHDILGYDQDAVDFFHKNFSMEGINSSYFQAFDAFVKEYHLVPDMARRVCIGPTKMSGVNIKEDNMIAIEERNIVTSTIKSITVPGSSRPLYPVLESYVRARRYPEELRKLQGLPFSKEEEIYKLLLTLD